MKILLISSSSGGHIYPSIALGNYLMKYEDIHYLGIKNRLEEAIIDHNITLINIAHSFKHFIKNPYLSIKERNNINQILKEYDVLICFGGFITFFILHFCNIENKLIYLHEANVDIGDSNKYSLRKAHRLFTTFPCTSSKYFQKKIINVGNPISDEIEDFSFKKYIGFVFGSLGARDVLKICLEYLITTNKDVILITGKTYYEDVKKILNNPKVKIYPYIDKNYLYRNVYLLFTRAGASTICEVIYTSICAYIIPSLNVKKSHQEHNAQYVSPFLMDMINEEDLTLDLIKNLIDNFSFAEHREQMSRRKAFRKKNVSEKIYQVIKDDYQKRKF